MFNSIRNKANSSFELCLCGRCLADFKSIKEYKIERINIEQTEKDICTFCNTRMGFDYVIESTPLFKSNNRTFERLDDYE